MNLNEFKLKWIDMKLHTAEKKIKLWVFKIRCFYHIQVQSIKKYCSLQRQKI